MIVLIKFISTLIFDVFFPFFSVHYLNLLLFLSLFSPLSPSLLFQGKSDSYWKSHPITCVSSYLMSKIVLSKIYYTPTNICSNQLILNHQYFLRPNRANNNKFLGFFLALCWGGGWLSYKWWFLKINDSPTNNAAEPCLRGLLILILSWRFMAIDRSSEIWIQLTTSKVVSPCRLFGEIAFTLVSFMVMALLDNVPFQIESESASC